MTTQNDNADVDWGGRLSPGDVHDVLFTRAGLGRRGYEEAEVDVFLERVQQEITTLIAEKADLRDEVARLKTALAQRGDAPDVGGPTKEEAQLQAVRLLAAAQQTADTYVADAEKYSQRVTADAREHSQQILGEARQAAQSMLEQAQRLAREAAERTVEGEPVEAGQLSRHELDQQVTYLKTFGQVCRVQLRAYLEALLRDVEEEWGRADPGVVLSVPPSVRPAELGAGETGELPPDARDGAPPAAEGAGPEDAPAVAAKPGGRPGGSRAPKPGHSAARTTSNPELQEDPPVEVDLTDDGPPPNGSRPGRRSGTVSHSR